MPPDTNLFTDVNCCT